MTRITCRNKETGRYWTESFDSPFLARQFINKCKKSKTVEIIKIVHEGVYYGEI